MKVGLASWAMVLVSCLGCSSRSTSEHTNDPNEPDAGGTICAPSTTRTCVGPGACSGGQICSADGSRWSACDCGPSAGGSSNTGGVSASGGANAQGGTAPQAGMGPEGGSGPQGGVANGGSGGSGGDDPCLVELLSDPGFDLGQGSWSQHSDSDRPAIVSESEAPFAAHSSPNLAWLGGKNTAEDYVLQTVTVTQPNAKLKVSMYIHIETLEEEPVIFDRIVLDTQVGDEAIPRITLSNKDASSGYVFKEADVDSVLAGTEITVAVAMSNDANLPTAFYVDSLSLTANICP